MEENRWELVSEYSDFINGSRDIDISEEAAQKIISEFCLTDMAGDGEEYHSGDQEDLDFIYLYKYEEDEVEDPDRPWFLTIGPEQLTSDFDPFVNL